MDLSVQPCRSTSNDFDNNIVTQSSNEYLPTKKELELWLRNRFTLQQIGKKKWLENRERRYDGYFPIEFLNDKELIIHHINKYGLDTGFIAKHLRTDVDVFIASIRQKKSPYTYVPNELLSCRDAVLEAAKITGHRTLHRLSLSNHEKFLNDKEIVLAAVTNDGIALQFASSELKNDKEVVLRAVMQNNQAQRYASETLTKDNDVFLTSICPTVAHKYSSINWNNDSIMLMKTLRNDREFIITTAVKNRSILSLLLSTAQDLKNDQQLALEAIKHDFGLIYLFSDLVHDHEFMLKAISVNVLCLRYSFRLTKQKEFMMRATRINGLALINASDDLRRDHEIVLEAVKQNGAAFLYATETTRSDPQIVSHAVERFGPALLTAPMELRRDKQFVLKALNHDFSLFKYVHEELRNDKEFIMQLITRHPFVLRYVSDELKNDKHVVLTAVQQSGLMLQYASEDLKEDKEVVLQSVKQNGGALNFASKTLQRDKQIISEALHQSPHAINFCCMTLRNDKEFMLWALKQHPRMIEYIGDKDDALILEAVKTHGFGGNRKYEPVFSEDLLRARMEHYYYSAYFGNQK
ncbi:hypothetical protein C9374_005246 [Naegleria lovaniensis]|uniref:DUF4116 domain-containing protein n=1 Tax=Naegleria lovaniensis TaxID=51637 RepID=A0AA88GKJ1_NAELO|nr:uncharacterized protein C9374_005246 [Naegleria lovaniensis]KAG2382666.1 hypothetical protein C9374_005246 [Naegleria lovaniensis]